MRTKILRTFTVGSLVVLFTVVLVDLATAGCSLGPAAPRCSCGDTVDSDTGLGSGDPVVSSGPSDTCPGTGLVLNAGLLLNLGGLTIRGSGVGSGVLISGTGTGTRILAGGTNASIIGFGEGVSGDLNGTTSTPGRITNIIVSGNSGKGINVAGNLNVLSGLHVFSNGSNGIEISGDRNSIESNRRR